MPKTFGSATVFYELSLQQLKETGQLTESVVKKCLQYAIQAKRPKAELHQILKLTFHEQAILADVLETAIRYGTLEHLKQLLEFGADPQHSPEQTLRACIETEIQPQSKSHLLVQYGLELSADGYQNLNYAVKNGNSLAVTQLLKFEVNPIPVLTRALIMLLSAEDAKTDMFNLLIQLGADLTSLTSDEFSTLSSKISMTCTYRI
jgi:ankyrin repeat protein